MITYGSTTLTSYNTITKIEVYYYKSTSATSLSGGSWSTTKPTWENGKYIWQKIRTTYEGKLENGQYYSESDPVNITGQQGATGTSAYSYKLNVSDTIITKLKTGSYSVSTVTFTATYKQGTGAVNAYTGCFVIQTSNDGNTWISQYTSSSDESSYTYTVPSNILLIKCSLYQSVETRVLLDQMTVPIVREGADGTSQNLLLDVYASSLTKVKAPWDRYLSDASNTTITGQFIAEDNLPDPNATHFYRITDSSATTKSRGLCFYNGNGTPPFLDGHTYRIGCWVRNHSGKPSIDIRLGSVSSWSNRKIITNTNWEWIECVRTFGDTDPAITAQASTYKRIYFYFGNNNVEGSSLDMCGFKIEEVQTDISTARNYLLKTENLNGWGVTNGTTISNGVATFPEVTSSTWREIYPTKNFKYEIIRNKNIIFSVRVKADIGKICACNLCIGVDSTETAYIRQKYINNYVYFTGTGEWQTICVAIPISDEIFTSGSGTPNYDDCWVTVRIGAMNTYYNSFQATQPQLSLGTTATTWSAAPEDIEDSMQEKVDNIEIGGKNLLRNSATFLNWLKSNEITINDNIASATNTTATSNVNYLIRQWVGSGELNDYLGTPLVMSFDIMSPDWDAVTEGSYSGLGAVAIEYSCVSEPYGSSILHTGRYLFARLNNTNFFNVPESIPNNTWIHVTSKPIILEDSVFNNDTSKITGYDYLMAYFVLVRRQGTVYLKNPKVERGTKPTDWTPAPEDTDANIQQVQNNLDNLEIGGRNLIIGTLNPDARGSDMHRPHLPGQTVNTSGRGTCTVAEHGLRFTLTEANWCYIYFGASGNTATPSMLGLIAGETYTLSADLSWKVLSSDTGKASTITYYMSGLLMYSTAENLTSWSTAKFEEQFPITQADKGTDMSGRLVFTFTVPEDAVRLYLGIRANNTTANHYAIGDYIEARNMKLEKGSKATDWSPAPEDMQDGIDTALAQANTALEQSVEYIVGTQTAATGTWTGATTDNELKIGKTIAYKLPYAGSGNASLVLTLANGSTTDAIPVYLNTTRVTTHFGAGSVINMTYDGHYWRASSIPNSNNYDRRQHNNAITAKTAIIAKHLIVGDSTGYQQITSTSGGALEFDLGYPILWAYSDIAATKTSTATYEAYPSVNFSTSGTIQDGAANKMLWLKGTIRGNIFTLASTNFLTTRIPTSDDGMYYIPLGVMSSATAGYFSSSNRIYAYIDEEFQPLDNAAALKASSAYETAVQARSEIVQTQQTLSLQIRDISVGGANLFERTKTFEGTANQSTAHDAFTEFVYKDLTVKSANTVTFGNEVVELSAYQYTDLTPNMWYSFSFYAKGNVDIGFMYAGTGNAVIDSIDVSWDNNTYTGFNTTSTSSNIIWLTPTNNWQRYSVVFHIEEQDITALHRLIGLYARPVSSYTELNTENKDILIAETSTDVHLIMEGNEVQICGYKLELGNKPTDWTPADNDKATYDNIISQINLSKEGIAIRADKIRLEGMITANEGFSIDEYGNMTANNGTFNGIFESYAAEINENTFDLSINNGHIQFYNNDRTLTEDERYVGYIGGIRKNTSFIDGSTKNNDAITIGLYNNSDFIINVYDNTTPTRICEVLNYTMGSPTFDFWVPARIYDGNKLQMYSRNESHGSQIEFRRYSNSTGGYISRGTLSLHSIEDNSDISDRLYLLSKNQGNDLAGDQFLYFAGKGLRYSSSGQPMRTGYVATDKYIVTQYFNLPNLTITKNTSQNFTIDVSRDGYTPIMCIPKVGGGQNAFYLSIYTWSMSGNIVTIRTHNNSSTSDVSNVTISLQVLYKLTY